MASANTLVINRCWSYQAQAFNDYNLISPQETFASQSLPAPTLFNSSTKKYIRRTQPPIRIAYHHNSYFLYTAAKTTIHLIIYFHNVHIAVSSSSKFFRILVFDVQLEKAVLLRVTIFIKPPLTVVLTHHFPVPGISFQLLKALNTLCDDFVFNMYQSVTLPMQFRI